MAVTVNDEPPGEKLDVDTILARGDIVAFRAHIKKARTQDLTILMARAGKLRLENFVDAVLSEMNRR